MVTPIGICLNFYEQSNNFIYVTFNGERVKLYDNNKLAIVDAAMQAEFSKEALFPRRGKGLNFTVDGKSKIVRGQLGEAAEIILNGERTDISRRIHANDIIEVKESTTGEPAKLEIQKLPEYSASLTVIVNDRSVVLPKFASVNGSLQSGYYEIQENDVIEMLNYYTIEQIAEFMDILIDQTINVYVNNKRAGANTKVYENFSVVWTTEELRFDNEGMDNEEMDYEEMDDEEIEDEEQHETEYIEELKEISVIANGRPVTMHGKTEYVFVDIFDYIDFDLSKVKGNGIATKRNGAAAQYMEPLAQGDVLEIYWKD